MRQGLALFSCLLLVTPIFFLSTPIGALNYSKNQNLSHSNASFYGEHAGDESGYSIASACDVNGDGNDDILIGAPGKSYSYGEPGAGRTYLIFGKPSGWTIDTNLSHADASFLGEHAEDWSGARVACAGDVNGDGYDDILIGAPFNDDVHYDAGKTYLIFGKASGWAMNTSLSNADASFIGITWDDNSGGAIASAGDVNGDGYDDILIGAPGNGDGIPGKTYLILGKSTGWTKNISLSKADASFIGEPNYELGSTIIGPGDVNGDGYDDVLIRADDGYILESKIYLIFGKASGWTTNTSISEADASFIEKKCDPNWGNLIADVGDVNGDGYNDILIGADRDNNGLPQSGITYLFFGKASGWTMNTNLSNADASFIGEHSADYSGNPVAGAGDVNGDGYNDFLIGANRDPINGGSDAGKTYLILGKASGWAMNTSLTKADASFIGEHTDDQSGWALAGAGDVNGDGNDDILIGAPFNGNGGFWPGKTYLIFGNNNSKPTSINSIKAYSDDSYSLEINKTLENNTVFIELQGVDSNSNWNDVTEVNVTSNASDPKGFTLKLFETGKNTGIYRGNFTVKNMTNEDDRWIKAQSGDTVTVSSVQDPSKKTTIAILGALKLFPSNGPIYINEDQPLKIHFWAIGPEPITWQEINSGDWLHWDNKIHNISGIPNNGDVGQYWVKITVSMSIGSPVSHNYTVIVNNTPPKIITVDNTKVLEDNKYGVDYNSTDDGQGTITWHLRTNATSWLFINSSTGYLSGKPANEDVGKYYVNVSVDDGNGGWDYSNFTWAHSRFVGNSAT